MIRCVKITESLSLRAYTKGGLFLKTELTKKNCRSDHPVLAEILRPYLEGRGDVDIELDRLDLSDYSKDVIEVYRTLRKFVPPGKVISYKELGNLTGKHPRFIGYAMRINRFPVLIPCHRVVSKRGVGGFSYGQDMKKKLLAFEKKLFGR